MTVLNHSTRCRLLLRLPPLTRQWGFSSSSLLSRLQQQQHQTWPVRCDQVEPSSLPLISWRAASAAGCPRFTVCTPPTPTPQLHTQCAKNTVFALWIVGDTCWLGGGRATGVHVCLHAAQRGAHLALNGYYERKLAVLIKKGCCIACMW